LQVFGRVQAIKLIRCSNFYPKAQIHKWLSKKCRSSSKKAEPFDRRSQHHFLLASVHRCPKKGHSPGLPVMAGRDFKNSDSPRPKNLVPGTVALPLLSRANASPSWIMLLLVSGRPEHGMIPAVAGFEGAPRLTIPPAIPK
jgi:hypothetical protein